jgi:hypothetical protein
VQDRARRSHEHWFHFTREPRYYSAVDEIREETGNYRGARPVTLAERTTALKVPGNVPMSGTALEPNPLGKLPSSVWTVPTEPLRVPEHLNVDHFAAMPSELPRRIILGWSPRGVCVECNEGRRPVAERQADGRSRSTTAAKDPSWQAINRADWQENVTRIITGYACACPEPTAPTTPAVVLDPFAGTGTTLHVAQALGRQGIGTDLSADYCRIASDPDVRGQRIAKVRGFKREKRVEIEGQEDLFGGVA